MMFFKRNIVVRLVLITLWGIAYGLLKIAVRLFQIQLNKQQIIELIDEEADETDDTSRTTALRNNSVAEIPALEGLEATAIEKLERVVVKTGQKIDVITVPEIVYFQAEGDYVRIFTNTDRFLKEDTIKYYQARLSETEFVRVHRSYLVNVTKILRIELYGKQNHLLVLSNGDKLKISASGYKRLREVLGL
ncbi:MAG: LytTR family transcriptional regulator DNA-binding domain-containing protein [Bacteroidales bacterium]|jgi:DNA-binding LytR/AlgR family response regulator|nr:LytTR family transcriptional regulator DNA-binding domain-containing protein [Bacteroidales bacterium]